MRKEDITLTRDDHHLYVTAAKADAVRDWADVTVRKAESFAGAASRTIKIGGKFDLPNMKCAAPENGELKIFVPRKDGPAAAQHARVKVAFA